MNEKTHDLLEAINASALKTTAPLNRIRLFLKEQGNQKLLNDAILVDECLDRISEIATEGNL